MYCTVIEKPARQPTDVYRRCFPCATPSWYVCISCVRNQVCMCVCCIILSISLPPPPPAAAEKFGEVKRKPWLRNRTQSGSHASSSFARINLSWGNFTTLAPGCRIEGVRRTAEVKRGSSVSLGWLTTDQQPLSSLGLRVTFASHEFLMWPCLTWSFVTQSVHLGPLKRHIGGFAHEGPFVELDLQIDNVPPGLFHTHVQALFDSLWLGTSASFYWKQAYLEASLQHYQRIAANDTPLILSFISFLFIVKVPCKLYKGGLCNSNSEFQCYKLIIQTE